MYREKMQEEQGSPELISPTTNRSSGKDYRGQSLASKVGIPTIKNQESGSALLEQRRRDKMDKEVVKRAEKRITAALIRNQSIYPHIMSVLEDEDVSDPAKIELVKGLVPTIEEAIKTQNLTEEQQRLLSGKLSTIMNTLNVKEERNLNASNQ
jgi:hypothetical protein